MNMNILEKIEILEKKNLELGQEIIEFAKKNPLKVLQDVIFEEEGNIVNLTSEIIEFSIDRDKQEVNIEIWINNSMVAEDTTDDSELYCLLNRLAVEYFDAAKKQEIMKKYKENNI